MGGHHMRHNNILIMFTIQILQSTSYKLYYLTLALPLPFIVRIPSLGQFFMLSCLAAVVFTPFKPVFCSPKTQALPDTYILSNCV